MAITTSVADPGGDLGHIPLLTPIILRRDRPRGVEEVFPPIYTDVYSCAYTEISKCPILSCSPMSFTSTHVLFGKRENKGERKGKKGGKNIYIYTHTQGGSLSEA